jgi:peptidoglycan/xylan/chitin deacetylase (PgdA/CDA1 family)
MSLQVNDRLFWPGGKRKALTLSYDDGIGQDRRLVELFNKYGVKATFNLNSGLIGQAGSVSAGKKVVSHNKIREDELGMLYKGHEIAGHGQYHESMYGMDSARCTEEILSCRKRLEEITGELITGYAYAFGACDETIENTMRLCGITYARTINSTYNFEIPKNFLMWDPTCHHDDKKLFELADEFLDNKPIFSFSSPVKLFYVWGHSYEFDQNDNWNRIETFLQKVTKKDDVWYATNIEVQRYADAYHQLVFSVDSQTVWNPTAASVWLGGIFSKEVIEVQPGKVTRLLPPIEM